MPIERRRNGVIGPANELNRGRPLIQIIKNNCMALGYGLVESDYSVWERVNVELINLVL